MRTVSSVHRDEFARYLADKGFYVVGEDHLGHGKSVGNPNEWGYFADKEACRKVNGNTSDVVLKDIYTLTEITKKKYPSLPYFVLGHSMGSFFARKYASIYGDKINGVIISGTGNQPSSAIVAAKTIVSVQQLIFGERHRSKLIAKMTFGENNKRIENPQTKNDWLTKDTEIVRKYNNNPANNFLFTLNANRGLLDIVEYVISVKHTAKTPKDLPMLFVSGEEDPVGEYGEGVKRAFALYQANDMKNIQMRLWTGDRHEILNETDRADVYQYIYQWILENIKK